MSSICHLQMIGLEHRFRPLHLIDLGHDGEDVTGAGGLDGIGKRGERTNVNHGGPLIGADYRPAAQGGESSFRAR